jgi:hypothetical protein
VQEGTRETRTGRNNIFDIILIRPEELWVRTKVIEGIREHNIPGVCLLTASGANETEKKERYYKRAREEDVRSAFKQKYTNDWRKNYAGKTDNVDGVLEDLNDIRQEFIPSKVIRTNNDPINNDKRVKKLKRKCRDIHKKKIFFCTARII